MSGTHGELFGEIGEMVFAAHNGQEIDLASASEDLASRYADLRLPADSIARAIARSASAVGVSLALLQPAADPAKVMDDGSEALDEAGPSSTRAPAFAGLPSGGRIAMLS